MGDTLCCERKVITTLSDDHSEIIIHTIHAQIFECDKELTPEPYSNANSDILEDMSATFDVIRKFS